MWCSVHGAIESGSQMGMETVGWCSVWSSVDRVVVTAMRESSPLGRCQMTSVLELLGTRLYAM